MSKHQISRIAGMALGTVAAMLIVALSAPPTNAGDTPENTQLGELYQLQAAFHEAATVHDPINGDSPAAIDQRIRDMLSLWTTDGSLGNYVGNGDPSDSSTCPPPSGNPANPGTLCTLFKYVVGSFQAANKFVSLSPSYKTSFDIHGNTASVYFECHYFDVSIDPTTGNPRWKAVAHLIFDGNAEKVGETWLLSRGNPSPPAGVPVPSN
jgi:hypothetical protein